MRILLVEADGADRFAFAARLEAEGYAVQVTSTLEAARSALGAAPFDCLVTSQLIPVLLGEAAVVATPPRVLVLSTPDTNSDRVRALELGADDVMTRPAEPRDLKEMALRVRNLLRGTVPPLQRPVRLGRVVVHRETRVVTIDGTVVCLRGPLQYAVLEQLALMAGQVVSTDVLIERCWVEARRTDGTPDLWTQISRLRSAFGAALSIESVYSVGYRLTVPEP